MFLGGTNCTIELPRLAERDKESLVTRALGFWLHQKLCRTTYKVCIMLGDPHQVLLY